MRRVLLTTLILFLPAGGVAAQSQPDRALFPPQNRPDVRGTMGAVSAGHPLAAAAGLRVLREGGNAVDAAVTMAAVLAVVRPHMNGVGGDAFALFYDGVSGATAALNGSGRAGALATPAFFREGFQGEIPEVGAGAVSVPGAVAAWADALEQLGTISLGRALEPAIRYAREGFPVSTRLAADFRAQGDELNSAGRTLYLPDGEPPAVGSLLRNPALAGTLEAVARGGKDAFYRGPVASRMAAFLTDRGGYLRAPDFAEHTSTWVEPLSGEYRGRTLLVMPPNTQGIAQLLQTEMAKSFSLKEMGRESSSYFHHLIEIKKLAFADRDRWVADPTRAEIPVDRLLEPSYLAERARKVDPRRAASEVKPGFGHPVGTGGPELDDSGDTVYLTAVDRWGNAVSWIQSLFHGFGSGLLDPETGVLFQNRGALFTLDEGHPNRVEPGKRPYHTLTPLMGLREDGSLAFTLGTPGGDSQTQSLLQIMNNLFLFDMTPQEAVEAPRFRSYRGRRVAIESRVPTGVRAELESLGHELEVVRGWTATFGGAQMILVEPGSGTLTVASDPRREAYGLAY